MPCALCSCSRTQRWLKSGAQLSDRIAHPHLALVCGVVPRGTPGGEPPLYNPIFLPCSGPHSSTHLKCLWWSLGQLSITNTGGDTNHEKWLWSSDSCSPLSDRSLLSQFRQAFHLPRCSLLTAFSLCYGKEENFSSRSPWLGERKGHSKPHSSHLYARPGTELVPNSMNFTGEEATWVVTLLSLHTIAVSYLEPSAYLTRIESWQVTC